MVFRHLDGLPPPQIYEPLERETILATLSRMLEVEIAGIDLTPASVAARLNDVHAGYAYSMLQHFNVRGRSVLLRFSTGVDLDHLGAWYGEAGIRGDGETDDVYRERLTLLPHIGLAATEIGIRAALLTEFRSTIFDIGTFVDFGQVMANTGLISIYTLSPWAQVTAPTNTTDGLTPEARDMLTPEQRAAGLAEPGLKQTDANREAYWSYLSSPDVLVLGQRFADQPAPPDNVGRTPEENIVPYTIRATVQYDKVLVSEDFVKEQLAAAADNFSRLTWGFGQTVYASQFQAALRVGGVTDVTLRRFQRTEPSGQTIGNLSPLATERGASTTFYCPRGDDVTEVLPLVEGRGAGLGITLDDSG